MPIRKKKANQVQYRSGYEQKVTDNLRRDKVAHDYETLKLKYTIPASDHFYTPDVILSNSVICELKGYMDATTRKKMQLVIAQNSHLDIRIVFQNPNVKLSKKSKTTYAMWATKNGIKWGVESDILAWSKE